MSQDVSMPIGGPGRARRPASTPLIAMNCRVLESTRVLASAAADAIGITMGRYVELLVQRDQLDSAGRPVWIDEVFPPLQNTLPGLERTDAA